MNIKSIINEEVKRLFEQDVYTIPELSQLLTRQGHDKETIDILEKYLQDSYRKYGDKGVIQVYKEITGVEIQALRNGRYVFDNLYTPEDYEGYIE